MIVLIDSSSIEEIIKELRKRVEEKILELCDYENTLNKYIISKNTHYKRFLNLVMKLNLGLETFIHASYNYYEQPLEKLNFNNREIENRIEIKEDKVNIILEETNKELKTIKIRIYYDAISFIAITNSHMKIYLEDACITMGFLNRCRTLKRKERE